MPSPLDVSLSPSKCPRNPEPHQATPHVISYCTPLPCLHFISKLPSNDSPGLGPPCITLPRSSLSSTPLCSSLALITMTPCKHPKMLAGSWEELLCLLPTVREPRGEYDRAADRMWGSESEGGDAAPPATLETGAVCQTSQRPQWLSPDIPGWCETPSQPRRF